MTLSAYDFSRGDTEEKRFQNLLAASANGNIKGLVYYEVQTTTTVSVADGVIASKPVTLPQPLKFGDMILGCSFDKDLAGAYLTPYLFSETIVTCNIVNDSGAPVEYINPLIRLLILRMT
jgi:hypothetical protein